MEFTTPPEYPQIGDPQASQKIREFYLYLAETFIAELTHHANHLNTVLDGTVLQVNGYTDEEFEAFTTEHFNPLKEMVETINGDSTVTGSFRKAIADVVGTSPESLDTLNEISNALNNDPDLYNTIVAMIATNIENAKQEIKGSVSAELDTLEEIEEAINLINANGTTIGSIAYAVMQEQSRAVLEESGIKSRLDVIEGDSSVIGSISYQVEQEQSRALLQESEIQNRLDVIEGDSTINGSIAKAIADAFSNKRVSDVSADAVNNKLLITYDDTTTAEILMSDITTDISVSGASLDATSNVLTLTSSNGGADVTVDLSDFVNSSELATALSAKQDLLDSGVNIKTINGESLLGSGDIVIEGSTNVVTTPPSFTIASVVNERTTLNIDITNYNDYTFTTVFNGGLYDGTNVVSGSTFRDNGDGTVTIYVPAVPTDTLYTFKMTATELGKLISSEVVNTIQVTDVPMESDEAIIITGSDVNTTNFLTRDNVLIESSMLKRGDTLQTINGTITTDVGGEVVNNLGQLGVVGSVDPDGANNTSTTDIAVGGTPIASSEFYTGSYNAINAFDDDTSTKWHNGASDTGSGWLGYQLSEPKIVNKVTLKISDGNLARAGKNYNIEASNDGINWDILKEITNSDPWSNDIAEIVTFTNSTPYSYYRYHVLNNFDSVQNITMSEMELIEASRTSDVLYTSSTQEATIPNNVTNVQVVGSRANHMDCFNDGSGVELLTFDNEDLIGKSGDIYTTVGTVNFIDGKYGKCVTTSSIKGGFVSQTLTAKDSDRSYSMWWRPTTSDANFSISTANEVGVIHSNIHGFIIDFKYSYIKVVNDPTSGVTRNHSYTFNLNEWYHIVVTYDTNRNYNVYINDILILSNQTTYNALSEYHKIGFGKTWFNSSTPFGRYSDVDQIRIFNKTLSPEEVSMLFDEESAFVDDDRKFVWYDDTQGEYGYGGVVADGSTNTSTTDAVPVLTSEIGSDGGFVINNKTTTHDSWNLFADNTIYGYVETTLPAIVGYSFGTPKSINKYTISTHASDFSLSPNTWTFEGSNDTTDGFDGNWTTIDSRIGETFSSQTRTFTCNNGTFYQAYRLNVSVKNGTGNLCIVNLEFIEAHQTPWITQSDPLLGSITPPSDFRNISSVKAYLTGDGSSTPTWGITYDSQVSGSTESIVFNQETLDGDWVKETPKMRVEFPDSSYVNNTVLDPEGANNISVISSITQHTSSSSSSGIVTTSEVGHVANYRAVNSDYDTGWYSGEGSILGVWWQYEFNTDKVINKIIFKSPTTGQYAYCPEDFDIKASKTGEFSGEEITLHNITGAVWSADETKIFTFNNSVAYKYYRLEVTSTNNSANSNRQATFSNLKLIEVEELLIPKDLSTINYPQLSMSVVAGGKVPDYNLLVPSTYTDITTVSDGSLNTSTTDSVPVLSTYAGSDGGFAFSSTELSSYETWRAFDDAGTWASTYSSNEPTGFIGYSFGTPKIINKYSLTATSYSTWFDQGHLPVDWTLEGSNDTTDGTDGMWDVLGIENGITWTLGEKKYFTVTNSDAYKSYRINVSVITNSSYYIKLEEIEFIEAYSSSNPVIEIDYQEENIHGRDIQFKIDFDKESECSVSLVGSDLWRKK